MVHTHQGYEDYARERVLVSDGRGSFGARRLGKDLPISRLPDTTKEQLVLDYRYHRPRTDPGFGG